VATLKLNLFVKLHPHAAKMRNRRARKLKPIRPSRANELWYKAELLKIVKLLRSSAERHLLPALKHYTYGNTGVGDATPPGIKSQFGAMRSEFGGIDGVAKRLSDFAVQRNLRAVDDGLRAAIKRSVGVDVSGIFAHDMEIRSVMDVARRANIDLITSIPEEYFDKLELAIQKNFVEGVRYEDLAKVVQHVADVTDSRVKVIARDQTSKMNSSFNAVRQQSVGIEKYTWQTSEDERVRESHAEHDGKVFRWDSPPDDTGAPGEDILCRCNAIPEFDLDEEEEALLADED
jgi:SPP1 gp7 family putative phage head morphogenesis protein